MLTITKRFPTTQLYMYGSAAFILGFAGILGLLVNTFPERAPFATTFPTSVEKASATETSANDSQTDAAQPTTQTSSWWMINPVAPTVSETPISTITDPLNQDSPSVDPIITPAPVPEEEETPEEDDSDLPVDLPEIELPVGEEGDQSSTSIEIEIPILDISLDVL